MTGARADRCRDHIGGAMPLTLPSWRLSGRTGSSAKGIDALRRAQIVHKREAVGADRGGSDRMA